MSHSYTLHAHLDLTILVHRLCQSSLRIEELQNESLSLGLNLWQLNWMVKETYFSWVVWFRNPSNAFLDCIPNPLKNSDCLMGFVWKCLMKRKKQKQSNTYMHHHHLSVVETFANLALLVGVYKEYKLPSESSSIHFMWIPWDLGKGKISKMSFEFTPLFRPCDCNHNQGLSPL